MSVVDRVGVLSGRAHGELHGVAQRYQAAVKPSPRWGTHCQ